MLPCSAESPWRDPPRRGPPQSAANLLERDGGKRPDPLTCHRAGLPSLVSMPTEILWWRPRLPGWPTVSTCKRCHCAPLHLACGRSSSSLRSSPPPVTPTVSASSGLTSRAPWIRCESCKAPPARRCALAVRRRSGHARRSVRGDGDMTAVWGEPSRPRAAPSPPVLAENVVAS